MSDSLIINGIDTGVKISPSSNTTDLTKLLPPKFNLPPYLGISNKIQVGDSKCSCDDYKTPDGSNNCGLLESDFDAEPVIDATTGSKFTFSMKNTGNIPTNTDNKLSGANQINNYFAVMIDNCLGKKQILTLDDNNKIDSNFNSGSETVTFSKVSILGLTPRSVTLFSTNSFMIEGVPDSFVAVSNDGDKLTINTDSPNCYGNNVNSKSYNNVSYIPSTAKNSTLVGVPYDYSKGPTELKKFHLLTTENQRLYVVSGGKKYFVSLIWSGGTCTFHDQVDNTIEVVPIEGQLMANMMSKKGVAIPYSRITPTLSYTVNVFNDIDNTTQAYKNAQSLENTHHNGMVTAVESLTALPPANGLIKITTDGLQVNDIDSSNNLVVSYICIMSDGSVITPYSGTDGIGKIGTTISSKDNGTASVKWFSDFTTKKFFNNSKLNTYQLADISSVYTIQVDAIMVYFKWGPKDNFKWGWKNFIRRNAPNGSNYNNFMWNNQYAIQSYNFKSPDNGYRWFLIETLPYTDKEGTTPYPFNNPDQDQYYVAKKLVNSDFTNSSLLPVTSLENGFDHNLESVVSWKTGTILTEGINRGYVADDLKKLKIVSVVYPQSIYTKS